MNDLKLGGCIRYVTLRHVLVAPPIPVFWSLIGWMVYSHISGQAVHRIALKFGKKNVWSLIGWLVYSNISGQAVHRIALKFGKKISLWTSGLITV